MLFFSNVNFFSYYLFVYFFILINLFIFVLSKASASIKEENIFVQKLDLLDYSSHEHVVQEVLSKVKRVGLLLHYHFCYYILNKICYVSCLLF